MTLTYQDFAAAQRFALMERELVRAALAATLPADLLPEGLDMLDAGLLDGHVDESSVAARLKEKYAAAVQTAKDRGRSALSDTQKRIVQLGGNVANVVRALVARVSKFVSEVFASARERAMAAVADKREKIVALVHKGDKKLLVEEVGHLRKIVSAMVGWMRTKLSSSVAKGSVEVATTDEGLVAFVSAALIAEGSVLESGSEIPFASAIAHRLHKVPPFSLLHALADGAEKVAAGALNRFSYYATKLADAPGPYEFVALAAIIGVVTEVGVKGVASDALVSAIPGIGTIVSIVSGIALGLAVISAVETALKDKE